jgi:hypothetical protein
MVVFQLPPAQARTAAPIAPLEVTLNIPAVVEANNLLAATVLPL